MWAKAAFLLLVDDGRNGLLGNPGGTGHTVHGELPRFCNSRAGPVKRVSYSEHQVEPGHKIATLKYCTVEPHSSILLIEDVALAALKGACL